MSSCRTPDSERNVRKKKNPSSNKSSEPRGHGLIQVPWPRRQLHQQRRNALSLAWLPLASDNNKKKKGVKGEPCPAGRVPDKRGTLPCLFSPPLSSSHMPLASHCSEEPEKGHCECVLFGSTAVERGKEGGKGRRTLEDAVLALQKCRQEKHGPACAVSLGGRSVGGPFAQMAPNKRGVWGLP